MAHSPTASRSATPIPRWGATNWQDANNRQAERALAATDVPRKLTIVGIWELPFFREKGTMTNRVLGGWQLSGFTILEAGRPYTVTTTAVWPNGDWNGDGTGGDRPNAPSESIRREGYSRTEFQNGTFRAADFSLPRAGN